MEGQAVTTNPWLIMAINMTVVFVVLILLGVLMTIVHLIDPTKKKKEVPASAPVAAPAVPADRDSRSRLATAVRNASRTRRRRTARGRRWHR